MQMPDVKTVLKKSDINFRFEVLAFRHLSQKEMETALFSWMRKENRKTLPHNRVVQVQTHIGFEG